MQHSQYPTFLSLLFIFGCAFLLAVLLFVMFFNFVCLLERFPDFEEEDDDEDEEDEDVRLLFSLLSSNLMLI